MDVREFSNPDIGTFRVGHLEGKYWVPLADFPPEVEKLAKESNVEIALAVRPGSANPPIADMFVPALWVEKHFPEGAAGLNSNIVRLVAKNPL